MDERVALTIQRIGSLEGLRQFEANARARDAISAEVQNAIRARSAFLGRSLISERTGLDLSQLSPAEGKIVEAVSEYVGVMKRMGKDATRTFSQIQNRGLLGAAEVAVAKSTPTQGFKTLEEADRVDLSYEQIILDHEDEFSPRAVWFSRRALGLQNDNAKPPARAATPVQARTEALLAWLRGKSEENNGRISSLTNADAAAALGMPEMERFGRVFGNIQSRVDYACYVAGLPPLGLAANAPFDKAWNQEGREWAFPVATMQAAAQSRIWTSADFDRVLRGTERLSGLAHVSWQEELSTNEAAVKEWAFGLESDSTAQDVGGDESDQKSASPNASGEVPYWVFVCNPKKWAIDRFLDRVPDRDTWGVRPSDRDRFSAGQLGIVRVGVDRRTVAERDGKPPLEAGVYALCEVESAAFPGTGAADDFWAPGEARAPGWPTVAIRYLRTYPLNPLTIDRLRREKPNVSRLLLDGFQAASFPISADDFHSVIALLGEDIENLPAPPEPTDLTAELLAAAERKYLHANPEVKERLSRTVERGPIGALVKRSNGFKCQVCEALGLNPLGFLKASGEPYVEAHHVMPVSTKQVGSLSASNVMTLCANHHRQVHYGGVRIAIGTRTFDLVFDGRQLNIPKLAMTIGPAEVVGRADGL